MHLMRLDAVRDIRLNRTGFANQPDLSLELSQPLLVLSKQRFGGGGNKARWDGRGGEAGLERRLGRSHCFSKLLPINGEGELF